MVPKHVLSPAEGRAPDVAKIEATARAAAQLGPKETA